VATGAGAGRRCPGAAGPRPHGRPCSDQLVVSAVSGSTPSPPPVGAGDAGRLMTPQIVVQSADGPPVHLLLVTEWRGSMGLHLAWPWLVDDVRAHLREAHRLEDQAGRTVPLLDSRVLPLAGLMHEVTYFDTSGLSGPQTLRLRLRSRLAEPVLLPFEG
jgi:hypothetical protein